MSKNKKPSRLVLSRHSPRKSAEHFLKTRPHLLYQQSEWLDYEGGAYYPVEDDIIKSEIASFADDCDEIKSDGQRKIAVPFSPKPADVKAIRDSLQDKVVKAIDTMSPPCWLDGRSGPDPKTIISCQNGLLDITTRELHEPTPAFFTRTVLPLDYDQDAPTPDRWLLFMSEVMGRRAPLIATIQEAMGYSLSADTRLQKVFYFFGVSRSGKGTIFRIQSALMGKRNVVTSSIETLGGRFGLKALIGKSGLFIPEMNSSNENISRATANICSISGEDDITAERKNMDDWTGKLGCRIWIASNNLPNFGQHAKAMMTRLIVIPFDFSFEDREDRQLTEKLLTELPGILNWALDGLDVLRMTGDFQEPDESKKIKARMQRVSEPLLGFLERRCKLGEAERVGKDELHAAYCLDCADSGNKALSLDRFAERLYALNVGISKSRRREDGGRAQVFDGVSLLPLKPSAGPVSDFEEVA